MKRSLQLIMTALAALIVPALGWSVTVDASTGLPTMDNYANKVSSGTKVEDVTYTASTFLAITENLAVGSPSTSITAAEYDLAIGRGSFSDSWEFSPTTDSFFNFSGAISANSLYIPSGQFAITSGNSTIFENAGDIYLKGQIWFRDEMTLTNNVYISPSNFTGDSSHTMLYKASFRLNNNLTLNGTTTLLPSSGEQVLIGCYNSVTTLTIGGTLDLSKVAVADDQKALIKVHDVDLTFTDGAKINLPAGFTGALKLAETLGDVAVAFNDVTVLQGGQEYSSEYEITCDNSAGTITIFKASDLVSKSLNGPTSASVLAIEDGKIVTLTAEAESSIDMDEAITVAELTTAGKEITFTGAEKLISGKTTVNADTDVSGITANLGAVTVAANKTLTGSWDQVTSAAGEGTFEVTADSTYTNSTIKNILITNGKLTSTYVSNGSGIASGRTITVDGAAEGSTAELAITVGDGTGYSNGTNSKIIIRNGAKLCYSRRDTLATAIELTAGKIELTADVATSNRAFDFFNNNDEVADISVFAADGATEAEPTKSYITALGTDNNRKFYLRRGAVEFNVADKAALDVNGYFCGKIGDDGEASKLLKTGAGIMTLLGNDASTFSAPVDIDAGTIKLCGASTLGTGTINVDGTLVYNTTAESAPTNTFTGAGTITADGCTLDLTRATLTEFTGSYSVINGGTLILPASENGKSITVTDGTLKLYVTEEQMLEGTTVENVTLPTDGNIVFVLPTGSEVIGTGTELPSQQAYIYTATVEGDNKWSTVDKWTLNGAAATSAPAGKVDIPVVLHLPEETTFYIDVEGLELSSLIVNNGELFLSEKPLTVGLLSSTHKVVVYNTLTLNAPGTETAPTLVSNVIEVENGGTLITKGYLNCSAANTILSGGTLEIASGVTTFNLAETGLSGTLKVAEGATCKNGTNDGPNWGGSPILDIAGTLEVTGTARWSLPASTTTTLREGAVLKGVGGTGYNYAYDWYGGATIKAEGNATIEGNIGAHEGNKTLTFDVAESKMLTVSGKYEGGTYNNIGGSKLKVIGTGTLKLTNTNTYAGGTEIAAGATLLAETPDALADAGDIVIAGTLKFAKASAYVNAFNRSAWGRMSGTGTVEFADGQWYSIASISTSLNFVNNNESNGVVIYRGSENYNQDTTIGTLSGSGWFRSDLGDMPRSLIIVQSANSEFSGYFKSYAASDGRFMNVLVKGAEGAEEKTLTLSGDSVYETDVNGLSIDATGSVNLTGSWAGNVTNNGVLSGTGSITGTLTLAAGATLDATAETKLSVTGAVTLPTDGTLNVKLANTPTAEASVQILAKTGLAAGDVSGVAISVVVGEAAADTESYKLVTTTAGYAVALDITVPEVLEDGTKLTAGARAALLDVAVAKGVSITKVKPAEGKTAAAVNNALQVFDAGIVTVVGGEATVDWHFGITDIKRNPNDMDQVIITAQVLDTDGNADTSAKIAAGVTVTVELTGVEVDSVTLTAADDTVDFEIALDDVTSGTPITVKATKTTND